MLRLEPNRGRQRESPSDVLFALIFPYSAIDKILLTLKICTIQTDRSG